MHDIVIPYPETPQSVSLAITEPSATFKHEVRKVMSSIVSFFIVYILLIILAALLAMVCVYGGFSLIIAFPKFFTIMIGAGLIGLGVMVFFFLIKFIFAVTRVDRTNLIEVTEAEHPKLFAFIRQLTIDTQTSFPKRIYLSPEVNACVFYDSSFWSMMLPIRKNLQIGLGLVNSLTLSEFKAVMAHEFGHFSQKSMKLGSFVYNVNRVIYNMLYENNDYGKALQRWADISGFFAIFASLTARIVHAIQWVLQKMYGLINKNYMGLSREMEFNADAIAASVSGSNNCISALRRIELADASYSTVIEKCNELLKENYILRNAYHNHRTVLKQVAKEFNLDTKNELPVVTADFLKTQNQNRINFTNQWASHPAMEERVKKLEAVNVISDNYDEPAWILFENPERLQQQLTTTLYSQVKLPEEIQTLGNVDFERRYLRDIAFFSLPEQYKGFYDNRQLAEINAEILFNEHKTDNPLNFEEIFSPENVAIPKTIRVLSEEIQLLNAIHDKKIDTKSFDFDGKKYEQDEAAMLSKNLGQELESLEKELARLDKRVLVFFHQNALRKGISEATAFKDQLTGYFNGRKQADVFFKDATAIIELLQPLYNPGITIETATNVIGQLKDEHEPKFKEHLNTLLASGLYNNSNFISLIEKFITNNYSYFNSESFFSNELDELTQVLNETWQLVNEELFKKFKAILEIQLQWLMD